MNRFVFAQFRLTGFDWDTMKHVRHKEPTKLECERPIVLVCPQFKSAINLARIVRVAGCFGIRQIIAAGNNRIDPDIARDSLDYVEIQRRRTLGPVLKKLQLDGYTLVGLEQTDQSTCLYNFNFPRQTALVVGHERLGIDEQLLNILDLAVEIPVYGMPYSLNVASATTIAIYEYCRQFPSG